MKSPNKILEQIDLGNHRCSFDSNLNGAGYIVSNATIQIWGMRQTDMERFSYCRYEAQIDKDNSRLKYNINVLAGNEGETPSRDGGLAAEKFGADKELFPKLLEHNKTQRSAMMTLNADDVVAHINFGNCLKTIDFTMPFNEQEKQWQRNVELTKKLNILTYAQANTNERGKAYAKAILIRDNRVKSCDIERK